MSSFGRLFGSAQAYVDMWSKVQTLAPVFTSAATVTFTRARAEASS